MDSLSQVPHIFLDPGFDLKNPDTFAKIFPFLLNSKEKLSSQIETHGKVTQEKFAHYLDSVEVNIADQVAQKSHHFFQVCQIKLFLYSSWKIDFLGDDISWCANESIDNPGHACPETQATITTSWRFKLQSNLNFNPFFPILILYISECFECMSIT